MNTKNHYFSDNIIKWYKKNKRKLPWRGTKNPYYIWLSEIILQQTRVEQGLPYYKKFINEFPTIFHLAKASEQKILKLWQGLGYYSRARNLHHTAKVIVKKYDGKFPENPELISEFKGIGDYTTAAISSFAFGISLPVVDGNVQRLLSRYFGIDTPPDSSAGKKKFYSLAKELIKKTDPAIFNQAIMEFGAMQCKPKNPNCSICQLGSHCHANNTESVEKFPVKKIKKAALKRYFNYLAIQEKDFIFLNKRTAKDIWKNLYEFPLIESATEQNLKSLMKSKEWKTIFGTSKVTAEEIQTSYKHLLSHQTIFARFFEIKITKPILNKEFIKIKKSAVKKYPVSRLMEKFILEKP